MLTCRKVFSSSLTSSASRGRSDRHDLLDERPVEGSTAWRLRSSIPETTFGVFMKVKCGFPGSMRSGE